MREVTAGNADAALPARVRRRSGNGEAKKGARMEMEEVLPDGARESKEKAVEILNGGVDVNARDFEDRAPLHLAAGNGFHGCCAILLESGADPNARDLCGMTPFDLALDNFLYLTGGQVLKEQGKHGRLLLALKRPFGSAGYKSTEYFLDFLDSLMHRRGIRELLYRVSRTYYDDFDKYKKQRDTVLLLARWQGIDCELHTAEPGDVEHPYEPSDYERRLVSFLLRTAIASGFRPSPLPPLFLTLEDPPIFAAYPELREKNNGDPEKRARRNERELPTPEWMPGGLPEIYPIEEVLGRYDVSPRITLYETGIGWFSERFGLDRELLRAVVLVHEVAHWITHLMPGPNVPRWPNQDYEQTSPEVHECLAQLLAFWVASSAGGRLMKTFEELNRHQSEPYRLYEKYTSLAPEDVFRSLEMVRSIGRPAGFRDWERLMSRP